MARLSFRSAVDQSPVWLAIRRPDQPAILIADPDRETRAILADDLEALDCDVFIAHDTEDLVQEAADLWPHVIVVDLTAAEPTAWEAIARLRQSSWTSGIRIIAISDEPEVRERAFETGCDAFLTKPFTPQVLRAQIRALTEPHECRSIRRETPSVPIRPAA